MFDRIRILRAGALAGSCLVLAALAGCSDDGNDFDISSQIGADPVLPEPAPALVADMKLAEVVGWQDGQVPSVPEGLTVTAYAKDLANPRTVYTLPNGDVLVVQSRGPSGGARLPSEGRHPRLDHVDGAWRRRANRRRAT